MAVEEHLPLCLHLVVAVAAQLRWLKARLLKMGGGGGEVGNPQPRKHLYHIVMACDFYLDGGGREDRARLGGLKSCCRGGGGRGQG